MKTRTLAPILAALVTVAAIPAAQAEARAVAGLDRSEFSIDDPAQLVVEVDDQDAAPPTLPQVDGVEFVPLGRSQQVTVTNGDLSAVTAYRYAVVAARPGAYTLPPIAVGGTTTAPIPFVVGAAGRATGAPAITPLPSGPTPPPSPPAADDAEDEAGGPAGRVGHASLQVIVPHRRLFVGESVPVTVRATVAPGTSATLESLPQVANDAFEIHGLAGRPTRSEETIGGVPRAVLTWRGRLTALLPGAQALEARIPATVQYREATPPSQRARRDPFGEDSPFNDPFFASFFGGAMPADMLDGFFDDPGRVVTRHVTLRGSAGPLTVAALPDQGRPAGAVAVGRFDLSAAATPATVALGEPVTLRVAVTGTGSFDRVAVAGLATTAAFRAYTPTESFAASDSIGLAGTKTFEQSLVPSEAGDVVLPPVTLTWFDPSTGAYATRSSAPIHLTVTPGAGGLTHTRSLDAPVVAGLRPDRADTGGAVATLLPVPHSRGWLFAPFALLGLALLVPGLAGREPSAARARRRARRRSEGRVRAALAAMKTARRAANPGDFLAAARAALQERIGARLALAPAAVTLADLDAHPELGDEARAVFAEADRAAFSGAAPASFDFDPWQERVTRALQEIAS